MARWDQPSFGLNRVYKLFVEH